MPIGPRLAILSGAALVATGGFVAAQWTGPRFVRQLEAGVEASLARADARGIDVRFTNGMGMLTRHPRLSGGENLSDDKRSQVAQAVAGVGGVGGVFWADGIVRAVANEREFEPLHCQEDVEGLLRTRSVRFQEASSALLPASQILLNEVAEALRPCLGSIIAITGHTDDTGNEPGNLALSLERARAVREALIARGIPRDGLRAKGLGSREPVAGLDPADPANRRIEFSVIRLEPLHPTPVDTPGPR